MRRRTFIKTGLATTLWLPTFTQAENLYCQPQKFERLYENAYQIKEQLNAFITIAKPNHSPIKSGELADLAISIKDDLFTKDLPTSGGSRAFFGYIPEIDAIPVSRLRDAGARLFAKCNLSEFAMHARPVSPLGGECLNPLDPERTPGGSSGGSAASIAAGVGDVSIATDSGGSIRGPAAFCGVIGFCPSNGKVPKLGSFGTNLFFSGIGAISQNINYIKRVMTVMGGPHPSDPQTLNPDQFRVIDIFNPKLRHDNVDVVFRGTAPGYDRSIYSIQRVIIIKSTDWIFHCAYRDSHCKYFNWTAQTNIERLGFVHRFSRPRCE